MSKLYFVGSMFVWMMVVVFPMQAQQIENIKVSSPPMYQLPIHLANKSMDHPEVVSAGEEVCGGKDNFVRVKKISGVPGGDIRWYAECRR